MEKSVENRTDAEGPVPQLLVPPAFAALSAHDIHDVTARDLTSHKLVFQAQRFKLVDVRTVPNKLESPYWNILHVAETTLESSAIL